LHQAFLEEASIKGPPIIGKLPFKKWQKRTAPGAAPEYYTQRINNDGETACYYRYMDHPEKVRDPRKDKNGNVLPADQQPMGTWYTNVTEGVSEFFGTHFYLTYLLKLNLD